MNPSSPEGIGTVLLAAGAFQFARRFLDTPTRLPDWEPYFKRGWVLIGLLIGASALFSITLANGWVALGLSLLFVYMLWQLKAFQPSRTVLLAVAPFLLLWILGSFLEYYAPKYYEANDDFIDNSIGFSTIWLGTFLLIASRQKKTLVKQEQERALEAEQRRIIEAKKQELEYLVAERTAEITLQKEELEHALVELKTTQNQLIQSEKMASLGELTAGIAHEIQNPLNFVNNFAEVSIELIDELADEQAKAHRDPELEADLLVDLKQNLQKINHHGGRASSIVKGMLQHSRASTGQREATDLNALCDEYLRLAYHGLRAKDKTFNALFTVDLDANLGQVSVVPQDISRVLLNLFTNAFYAVQQRQKQAGSESGYQPTVRVSTRCAGSEVVIKVIDNGTGMSEEVQQKIFQPFFTTKPTGEGTGLGLSLAYEIITKGHQGSLKVASKEGD
ncbi:ATP-binding protein [Spirosoma pollinicola]|uniref:histidine kinase n=1 Tax=Spirosoma pollinicola TaxID=2057025 RepID=A0A2K8YXZ7_9BACT|nr:ATP-binding protein [Spirosoma pollinicola]AUD02454.1 histidine kinase [Spirosoma pollinicola]